MVGREQGNLIYNLSQIHIYGVHEGYTKMPLHGAQCLNLLVELQDPLIWPLKGLGFSAWPQFYVSLAHLLKRFHAAQARHPKVRKAAAPIAPSFPK